MLLDETGAIGRVGGNLILVVCCLGDDNFGWLGDGLVKVPLEVGPQDL